MSNNAIEITQSTLLKLLIRRGSNAERKNITLSEGELGYTVDTQRLFVGDGATVGGVPASPHIYYGASAPNTYTQAVQYDLAYDSTIGVLYILNNSDPTSLSNWKVLNLGGDSAPTTLEYSATVTPNFVEGSNRQITLAGDLTLNGPINGSDGNTWRARLSAFGSNRDVTLGADIATPVGYTFASTVTADNVRFLQMVYNGSKWCVTLDQEFAP